MVADTVPDFAGPLAGILAALDYAAANRPEVAFGAASAAADRPFLPRDFVSRLHTAREAAGTPLACAEFGRADHLVNALWPIAMRQDSAPRPRRGGHSQDRRLHRLLMASRRRRGQDRPFAHPFFNANAPEDLVEADGDYPP